MLYQSKALRERFWSCFKFIWRRALFSSADGRYICFGFLACECEAWVSLVTELVLDATSRTRIVATYDACLCLPVKRIWSGGVKWTGIRTIVRLYRPELCFDWVQLLCSYVAPTHRQKTILIVANCMVQDGTDTLSQFGHVNIYLWITYYNLCTGKWCWDYWQW